MTSSGVMLVSVLKISAAFFHDPSLFLNSLQTARTNCPSRKRTCTIRTTVANHLHFIVQIQFYRCSFWMCNSFWRVFFSVLSRSSSRFVSFFYWPVIQPSIPSHLANDIKAIPSHFRYKHPSHEPPIYQYRVHLNLQV